MLDVYLPGLILTTNSMQMLKGISNAHADDKMSDSSALPTAREIHPAVANTKDLTL
jgi:hypothetical protein